MVYWSYMDVWILTRAKKNQEFFGGDPEALYVTRLKKEPPDKPAEKV
jgi:hypothetical protein